MHGKVCVITGGTSGIGLCAARALAAKGANLVMVARDIARARAMAGELRALSDCVVTTHYADLSSIADMKRVGTEIANTHPHVDVLINNAGGIFGTREITLDGLERTFALNHLSYFVLANSLRENLLAAKRANGGARVVNVASRAHRGEVLDFSDLQSERDYRWFRTYGRSKLANILFSRELARRWAQDGITVNCLHPGFVTTRFGANNHMMLRALIRLAMVAAISPEKGADTVVYLASSPDAASVTGQYFFRRQAIEPDAPAQDDAAAAKLWAMSAHLSGLRV